MNNYFVPVHTNRLQGRNRLYPIAVKFTYTAVFKVREVVVMFQALWQEQYFLYF